MEQELALQGNYEALRMLFFKWRELITKKCIHPHGLAKLEIELCKSLIYNKKWSIAQAHELYNVMVRYSFDMKKWGVDFSIVPRPTFIQAPQIKKDAVIRIPTLYYDGEYLVLSFPWNEDFNLKLQHIKPRIFDKIKKVFLFPIYHARAVMAFAEENGFAIGESAKRVIYDYDNNFDQSYSCERIELSLPLKKELFDYQTVGVDFGIRVKKVLNADQMGLGKTPQAIATAVGWNKWPILIVCPKSLRFNWKEEIEKWCSYKAMIATQKNMSRLTRLIELNLIHFVIVNYDGLKSNFVTEIKKVETKENGQENHIHLNGLQNVFKGCIIDEGHEFRNQKTMRYKIAKKIIDNLEYRQILTGTPYVNNERDIASILELLGVLERFGGFGSFMKKYSNMDRNNFYGKKGQPENLAELNTKLRSICMIRREKHQVLAQLPDKFRSIVKVELDNRKEYDLAYISLQAWMVEKNFTDDKIVRALNAEILTRISVLKQLCAKGKVASFAEFANNIIEQGEKLAVFVWHRETIDAIREYFPYALEVSGRTSDQRVRDNIHAFQNDPKSTMIILTYKRGGVGHTLTAASNVAMLELAWNPASQDQAEDRLHRIGQKGNVNVHYFLGKDTIDEWLYSIIEQKRKFSKESVGSTENIETSVQTDLIHKIISNENPETNALLN